MEKLNTEYHRPWGYYIILADEDEHKVKRIVVKPGKRLSLQLHHKRSEHWYMLHGKAVVTLGDRQVQVNTGEAVDIPKETAHRVQNPGSEEITFIEIQTGEYFGEDDIERLEDDFGRI
ncbi:MAG: cupin domain-containing protein [Proteobacteria bacterium]|nr:cupin domain-containing protein [Pseudomonadota bacterium]